MKTELKGTTLHIFAESADQWAGSTVAIHIEDGMVVCGRVKTRTGEKVILKLRLEGKSPEFLAAVGTWQAARADEAEAARAKRDADQACDQSLLASMELEADRLRTLIPSDHIPVIAIEIGRADGDPIYRYEADAVEISLAHRARLAHHGWASAIRPGAMNSFAAIQILSISRNDLDMVRAEVGEKQATAAAEKKAEEARIAAIFTQARETGERVALRTYMVECDDPREECSWDAVTVWAMPAGARKETRIHTF